MKTFDERKKSVQGYLKKAKARKRTLTALKVAANIACVVAIIIGLMHIPYGSLQADVPATNPFTAPDTNEPLAPTGAILPPHSTWPTQWPTYPFDPTEPYYTVGPDVTTPPEPEVTVTLEIWVDNEQMAWMVEHHTKNLNAGGGLQGIFVIPEIKVLNPDEVRVSLLETPPEMWPDIVCVDQTDVKFLASFDMLTPIYGDDAEALAGKNDALSKKGASYGSHIYAAPLYHRDGYFLYYDRSVISDEDAGSLEAIIAACEAADKKFCFDLDNPYYQAAFYLGAGWYSFWEQDKNGEYTSYRDNLNSTVGEVALQGMQKLLNSSCYITPGKDGMYSSESYEEAYSQSAAIVSGAYEYTLIKTYMEDMAVVQLPAYEAENGSYQLGSFANTVMLALPRKGGEDGSAIAAQLAIYLTNETNQLDYFHEWGWITTNLSAQASLKGTSEVEAFVAQSRFAVPMKDFPQRWWDYLDHVPSNLVNGLSVTQLLQDYQRSMDEVVADYPAEWFVVGQVNGSFWNAEYRLVGSSDWNNLLITDQPLYFEEDSEFLLMYVDRDDSIKEFYGQDGKSAKVNFKPGLTGYYYVVYDPATGECTYRQAQPE